MNSSAIMEPNKTTYIRIELVNSLIQYYCNIIIFYQCS